MKRIDREQHAREFLEWLTAHWAICHKAEHVAADGAVRVEFSPTIEDIDGLVELYSRHLAAPK